MGLGYRVSEITSFNYSHLWLVLLTHVTLCNNIVQLYDKLFLSCTSPNRSINVIHLYFNNFQPCFIYLFFTLLVTAKFSPNIYLKIIWFYRVEYIKAFRMLFRKKSKHIDIRFWWQEILGTTMIFFKSNSAFVFISLKF